MKERIKIRQVLSFVLAFSLVLGLLTGMGTTVEAGMENGRYYFEPSGEATLDLSTQPVGTALRLVNHNYPGKSWNDENFTLHITPPEGRAIRIGGIGADGTKSQYEIESGYDYLIINDFKYSGTVDDMESLYKKGANKVQFTSDYSNPGTFDVAATVVGYKVTYNANGATSGTAPVDNNCYWPEGLDGQLTSIAQNTGNLQKTGFVFDGWNTKADGSGSGKTPGTNFTVQEDLTLYAQWKETSASAPVIMQQPSNLDLTYGHEDASLEIKAVAALQHTLSYQWYEKENPSDSGGTLIDGATESSYTISPDVAAGTHEYFCIVTATRTEYGTTATATSDIAKVKIDQRKAEVKWSNTSLHYNGEEQGPTVEVTNLLGDDEVTVSIDGKATDVGTYMATITGLEGEDASNYKLPDELTRLYSITKGIPELTLSLDDWTYGSTAPLPEIDTKGAGDYKLEYKLYDEKNTEYRDYDLLNPPTETGTYNIRLSVSGDSTYEAASVEDVFTIHPKVVGIKWIDEDDEGIIEFIYNGSDKCPRAVLTGIGSDEAEAVVSGASSTVGTHTATITGITGKDASNYKLPENVTKEYTIIKADLPDDPEAENPAKLSMEDWTYGDSAKEPVVENNIGGGTITFTYLDLSLDGAEFTTAKPVNAGHYMVKAVIGATDSYNSKTLTAEFNIYPREVKLEWNDIAFVYDGEEHVPICEVTNLVAGDVCNVSVVGAESDPGNWIAEAEDLDNPNYCMPEGIHIQNYTISKGDPQLTVSLTGWTFGDTPNEPKTEGYKGDGTIIFEYFTDEECEKATTEADGAKEDGGVPVYAGTYFVKASVVSTDKYDASFSIAEFTISPLTAELTWTDTELTYNGKEQKPTAQIANQIDESIIEVTVDGAAVNAGDHTATATELSGAMAKNYKLPENAKESFTIAKKPAVFAWDKTEFVYNGKDQIPTATVSNLEDGDSCKLVVTGAATAVGTHTAVVTRVLNNNYDLPEDPEAAECKFEIKKAKLPEGPEAENPATLTIENWAYGDVGNDPVVENNIGGGTVNFSYADWDLNPETDLSTLDYKPAKPTKAGAYVVKAEIGATESYESATLYKTFNIDCRVADLEWGELVFEYDGKEHIPTCEVDNLIEGDECEVTVVGAQKDVGDEWEATAIELSNVNYTLLGTPTKNFIITKGTPAFIVSIDDWTYGDKPQEPEIYGYDEEYGDVDYTYYTNKDCTVKTTEADGALIEGGVPAFVGTYYLEASVAETAGYEAQKSVAEFSIEPRTAVLIWSDLSLTYNGKVQQPTAEVKNLVKGDEITVILNGAEVNAGKYTAEAIAFDGDRADNYELPEIDDQEYRINKLVAELEWGETTFVYNRQDQIPTVTIKNLVEGDTCKMVVTGAATAVGKHTAYVTRLSNDNYDLPEEAECLFEIIKADLDDAKVILDDWTYGDNPKAPRVEGNVEGANVTYMYKGAEEADDAYTPTVPTLAGDYTVKATIASTAGYNGKEVTDDFSILKRPLELVLTMEDWVYGEDPFYPILEGNMEDGDETYAYFVDPECTEPTTTENSGADMEGGFPVFAGEYTLKVTVAETDNYLAGVVTASFTIEKADIEFKPEPAAVKGLVYNGKAQKLVSIGISVGGEVVYALGGNSKEAPAEEAFSKKIPTGVDAGSYYVWYKAIADRNHNDTDPVCIKNVIAKAEQKITANNMTIEPGKTASINAKTSGDGKISYTLKSGSSIKVDANGKVTAVKEGVSTVAITAAETTNYKKASKVIKVTVMENTVDVYRLYNASTGEHLYSKSAAERDALVAAGWKNEGTAWQAPVKSKTPIYRVYNPNADDHHYTISAAEKDQLVAAGWKDEGIVWYSDDYKTTPVYRVYNPNAASGAHHFTKSKAEVQQLVAAGWKDEGIAFYCR